MRIKSIMLVEKQLDNPLPWYKNMVAKIINLNTNHEFIIF